MDRLDKIDEQIQKDTELTRDSDFVKANLDIPYLHHRYLMKYEAQYIVVTMLKNRKAKSYHATMLYYSGKASPDTYKERPLDYTILKSDLETWINADEDYIYSCEQLTYAESVLNLYKKTVDNIAGRSWIIKNHIDLMKFENAEY